MPVNEDRRRLVEDHLGLVRAQAAEIVKGLPQTIEFDDLVAYGTTGLCEAAERFEPERGLSFSTFAYYRIRGAIYDGLRSSGWLRRREYERVRQRERVDAYLQSHADRTGPATSLDREVAGLADTLAGVATIFVASLEAEMVDPPADGPAPGDALELGELGVVLRRAIAELPEQERRIVEDAYFGGKNLLEAGAAIGISKSWASRVHASAIDHLRRAIAPEVSGEPRTAVVAAGPAAARAPSGPARAAAGAARPARAAPPTADATSRPPRR
ncbi:MAG TPA: sigma-70 family RNA polymerase sigma factor [Polyangia bacterium]|jgi:RNA polymerase sigma factor for flagellar operon FliA